MRVVLVAGTPAEHSVEVPGREGFKDFADQSYNYAIGLLKACALERSGRNDQEVLLEDIPLARTTDTLSDAQIDSILSKNPDVVGFSCYAWDVHVFVKAVWQLKQKRRSIRTVLGGPSVTHQARKLLESYPFLDVIVRGEGEWPFINLCSKEFKQLETIEGISYRTSAGEVVEVGEPGVVPDLAELPSPYLSGHFTPDSPSLLIEPSRGCKFRCAFCSWSTKTGGLRLAGKERLLGEVRWALERGYRFVNFCDTAINHDTETLAEFCDTLLEADPEHRLSYSVFLRQESLDEQQFLILERMRFEEIILGLESIHAEPLKACGKRPLDIPEFERRLARLGRAGQKVTLSFISGLPGDTVAGFGQTLEYLSGLQARMPEVVNILCCFWLSVLPGTRFEAKREEYGFKTVPKGTPYIVSSRDHTTSDLVAMARMLVEYCELNQHFRCEEVHRDASQGRFPLPAGRNAQRPSQGSELRPATAGVGGKSLRERIALDVGQVLAGWTLVEADTLGSGERLGGYRFQRDGAKVEVMVERRNDAKACFIRTAWFNVYYHGDATTVDQRGPTEELLRQFARLAGGEV